MTAEFRFFKNEEVSIGGSRVRSLDAEAITALPTIEQICCRHIDTFLIQCEPYLQVLPHIRGIGIYLIDDPVPEAHIDSPPKGGTGQIRITTGLLSLVAVLSARAAIIIEETQRYRGWLSPLADKIPPDLASAFRFHGFGTFAIEERKRAAAALDASSQEDVAERLLGSPRILVNTFELAAAAIEFVVLHEIGHFDAGHHEARRLQMTAGTEDSELPGSYRPSIKVQRFFEHQADTFGLRLMIASARFRPLLSEDYLTIMPDAQVRFGANFVAYIGTAIDMSIAALMRARDPVDGEDVELLDRPRGEHPLPTTRIRVANLTLEHELAQPEIRQMLWPGFVEVVGSALDPKTAVGAYLHAFSMQAMMLAMSTVSRRWETAVNTISEEHTTVTWKYLMQDDAHWASLTSYYDEQSEDVARSLNDIAGSEARRQLEILRANDGHGNIAVPRPCRLSRLIHRLWG